MKRLSSRSFPADDVTARDDGVVPRIRVDDDHDRAFWALVFGVTAFEIRHAVGLVGSVADAVSHYLRYCDVSTQLH